jgi:hypothetical protein
VLCKDEELRGLTSKLILLFGIVNACLFSALLPLWEGFDEAFHYGYVETLWQTGRLPVLGRTLLPTDVLQTFPLVPVSHIVHRWIPAAITYGDWWPLSQAEKQRRRNALDALRPEPGVSSRPNYEALHPPLAYLVLAPIDLSLSKVSITTRVLVLRLFAAAFSIVLLFFGARALCRSLGMPEPFLNATLFTMFCSEMLYATIAHVANDWLAVALAALFMAALAAFARKPDRGTALITAALLAAGLLTKAYFLAFAILATITGGVLVSRRRAQPGTVVAATLLILVLAGPWYARNLVLYGNLSGTYEQFDGIGIKQTLAAAPKIDWVATSGFLSRGSLWTGNNSFTTFSRATLDIMLALLFLAILLWVLRRSAIQLPELFVFGGILLFSAAIAYDSCANFARMNGDSPGSSPWHTQVLLAPVLSLAYLGMSRWKLFGTVLAAATTAIWGWVLIATWTVKLFPMYSGAGASPMRLRDVGNWYLHGSAAHEGDLSLLALARAPFLYAGLLVCLTLTILIGASIIRSLARGEAGY